MTVSPIKSAVRVLEVLDFFRQHREPVSLKGIAEQLNYPASSATVLLKNLTAMGYLSYDRAARTYFPTLKVAALGDWISHELFGGNGKVTATTFVVRGRGTQLDRPVRPHQWLIFLFRRHRHQFELRHRRGAMTVRCTDTIRAGIATTNHDDMLALDVDRVGFALLHFLILWDQEFQRGINTLQLDRKSVV